MPQKLAIPCVLGLVALTAAAPAHAQDGQDLVFDGIALRAGVTVDVHVAVYENTSAPCSSGTLLAIHGAASTAKSLEPLAQAIAAMPVTDRPVCRVVTMDLPGHGEGALPSGALFGELTLDDYATAVIATLGRLDDAGIRPTTILGHSMGGLVVQIVQDELLNDGSSLWDAFHVSHAILLSPALPASVPWSFREGGGGMGLMAFAVDDPTLGDILSIPPFMWPAVAFGTLDGSIAEGALSPEEMVAGGYIGPESMAAVGAFFGLEGYAQRDVAAGIFADEHGTTLDLVSHEQDTIITVADVERLFPYLTGRPVSDDGYLLVEGAAASHGYPISHPDGLLDAFEDEVCLP